MNSEEENIRPNWLEPKSAYIDAVVLGGILLLLNWGFDSDRMGWRHLEPCPYFLLPILIGSRYGFSAGTVTGAAASFFVYSAQGFPHGLDFQNILVHEGYFCASMILVGSLCGELHSSFRSKELRLTEINRNHSLRLKELDSETFFLREAKAELERIIAARDSELSTLDSEMRRLFDSEKEDLGNNTMMLLNKQARVEEGALYLLEKDSRLRRLAVQGKADSLAEFLEIDDIDMVKTAWEAKKTVSLPEFWDESVSKHRNFLMVVPLLNNQNSPMGVLVVTGIPFIAFNKESVNLITLICRWASRVIEIHYFGSENYRIPKGQLTQRIFFQPFFESNLKLAVNSQKKHGLPSSVVLFYLPSASKDWQARLEKRILFTLRNGDIPAQLDLPFPNLAVLLPLSGARGCTIFIKRILGHCLSDPELRPLLKHKIIPVQKNETHQSIWNKLLAHE